MRTRLIIIVIVLLGMAGFWPKSRVPPSVPPASQVASHPVPAATTNFFTASPGVVAAIRLRPLAIASESNTHQWTAGDGKDPAIIKQLAHNELEAERMIQENETIFRRQLVYRKQTMSATAQHAIQSGEPIRELLVPGLDGKEYQVEVRALETTDGGGSGTFSGHILGQPDSMVTMAFRGGREAFTIVSTTENIFITAEPREPGEVVVKKVDPDKYGGLNQPCTVN